MKKLLFSLFTLFTINSFADCPGMTVTLNMINPYCAGSCDGHGYVSVSGGSGNYNYFYQDASTGNSVGNQVNDSIYGLCAGTYRVIVQDITNACFDTTLFSMVDPQPLSVVATANNTTCFGSCDGLAVASVSGGTPPYAYMWNNGATTPTIANLCAGTYFVQVYDANGCFGIFTVLVNQPNQINFVSTANSATCGQCDAVISTNVTGGAAPYTYQWDGGLGPFPQHTGVCPGTYNGIVTDANGCIASTMVTVYTATNITVSTSATTSSCSLCDGTVTVVETGGTAPYTYDLTGMSTQTNGNFSGVCPGSFVATVTDNNGCTGTASVNVMTDTIPGLTVTNSIQHESGVGANDGFIDLDLTGSTGPYTFLWSNGATTEDIYSLSAGVYTVTITDNNGDCSTYMFTLTTTPSYGFITGQLYNDVNQNCVFDSGDSPLANYYVVVTDGSTIYYGFTNANGEYSVWVPSGNYTVTAYNTTNLTTGCTSSYNVNVTNGSTISGNDFSYSIPSVYDVCVYAWSPGIVPGFNGYYYFYVNNNGNTTADGEACFVLPAGLTFVGSIPSASSISGDTICFNYTGLVPYGSNVYIIQFNAPASLSLGTPMVACMEATVTNGVDVNPGCNYYCYTRIVSGSFDPNDKSVSPAGENATGDILVNEDEFTYLVRFQNTGTGPAVNVVIYDTLSSLLDPATIEVLNASHNYVVELIDGNVLRFKFENIMLPDSGSNEPGSHGHVQFRIKTMNTPVIGQVINNTADIYFDFNEPVITNTTVNTYVAPNGIDEISVSGLMIYPNPANEVLYIQNLNGGSQYVVMDISGKVVLNQNSVSMNSSIDISNLTPGVYILQSISTGSIQNVKFIKR